jgi:exodeoxyribonuclease V alpha subunit
MPKQQLQPVPATQTEQIAGLVERVTFHSDESGFCVLRIKARGHRDLVTVVGTLPEVHAGEWLEARGRWIVNKEYGQQFQAELLRTMSPTTVEGIEKYLASGMIKGIGPVLAGRIVKNYASYCTSLSGSQTTSLNRRLSDSFCPRFLTGRFSPTGS